MYAIRSYYAKEGGFIAGWTIKETDRLEDQLEFAISILERKGEDELSEIFK